MSTSVFLAPAPINVTQFIPGGAIPASGAKLFGYLAGTSTKQAMYVDNTGTTQWSNPIILDSGGNLTGSKEVWIAAGIPMKFVLAPSTDTDPPLSPYWSVDNISGINDLTQTDSEWIGGPTPTFISATQFSLVGDQTLVFTVNRRVKSTNTGGTIFSTISVSSFGGGITTITVVNDSGVLDAGLSAVFYGLIPPTSNSLPRGVYNVTNLVASGNVSSASVSSAAINGYVFVTPSGVDDMVAVSNAVNSLGPNRGTVIFKPGTFLFSSTEVFDGMNGLVLMGEGSITAGATPSARLIYTGGSTTSFLSARSCSGFRMSGLMVQASSNSFPTYLLDLSNTGLNSQMWSIDRNTFIGMSATSATLSSAIYTNNAISGVIKENVFLSSPIGILGRSGNSTNFCNAIQVVGNVFTLNNIGTVAIRNPGQAWTIKENTFEALSNSTAAAIDSQSSVPFTQSGIMISGNWFGDGNGQGNWISVFGAGVSINGNFFSTGSTAISVIQSTGISINGNSFSNLPVAVDAAVASISSLYMLGNSYSSVTTQINNSSNVLTGMWEAAGNSVTLQNNFVFPTDRPFILTGQSNAAGASTATFTNSPHLGNPVFWPKIAINGSTLCFPAFQTS